MESFKLNLSQSLAVQTKLIMDIYCWQHLLMEEFSKIQALRTGEDEQTIRAKLTDRHQEIRECLHKKVFIEMGPELGNNILSGDDDAI